MRIHRSKKFCIGTTSLGIGILLATIIYYPSFLPRIISHENTIWIDQISYIFYALLFGSIIFTAFNVYKMFQMWHYRINASLTSSSSSSSSSIRPLSLARSLFQTIIIILNDKKYFRIFWSASIGYGIFYALISSMIIFRFDNNLSSLYGVTVPSITMISYGPVGYVPIMAVYVTEHIGLLVIPINLIVTLVISALVGLNTGLSVYAFAERPKKYVNTATGTSSIMGVVGATTSLFAVCPTCASFYIFNVMAGSLAPTIAAFAVSYYALFVVVSIPLLLVTLFITALSIRRMMTVGQCYLK